MWALLIIPHREHELFLLSRLCIDYEYAVDYIVIENIDILLLSIFSGNYRANGIDLTRK
jgi:hypothetical protein